MSPKRLFLKLLAGLALVSIVMALYAGVARPYQLAWGATAEELHRPMPGDELDPAPTFLATRAITIAAPPAAIWPWLVQMGYGRAGFYGYDLLENLGSPSGLASAGRIVPEWQHFSPGDAVPISPVATLRFQAIEAESYLIWSSQAGEGGFTWALYPLDGQHTRLVSRIRWSHHGWPPGVAALDLLTEFSDHLAVRKVLQGVKGRVEGRPEPAAVANLEFGVFVAAAFIFLGGLLVFFARPPAWKTWLAALAAGLGWLVAWYAPLPAWGGLLVELAVAAGVWRAAAWRGVLPPGRPASPASGEA